MMHKYTVLLLLSVLSLMGQAQSLSFQELLNKKKFTEEPIQCNRCLLTGLFLHVREIDQGRCTVSFTIYSRK